MSLPPQDATPRIDQLILDAVDHLDGIVILVLFGSHATGKTRPNSDLDLAVIVQPNDPRTKRSLQSKIASAVEHLSGGSHVDVVFIDESPDTLRHAIMRDGRMIICRDEALWKSWRVRTMREHSDRAHYRRILREGLKRRLLAGETNHGRPGTLAESLERLGLVSD